MTLDTPDPAQASLGAEIRRRRRARGLTLITLAAQAGISHPFLSQLERGYARPSMSTLERIAKALETTQVSLMLAADPLRDAPPTTQVPAGVQTVRADAGARLPHGSDGAGHARLLVRGAAAFYPQEQVQYSPVFGEFFCHDQDEWVHVVLGDIEIEIGVGNLILLHTGDSIYYAGGIPHRWRVIGDGVARLIVVQAAVGE